MTTLDQSTIVTQATHTARSGAQAWQLGILTDRAGHVHLGAVMAGSTGEPNSAIDAAGAATS